METRDQANSELEDAPVRRLGVMRGPVERPAEPVAVAEPGAENEVDGEVSQQGALGRLTPAAPDFQELPPEQSKLVAREEERLKQEALEAEALWNETPEPLAWGLLSHPVVKWLMVLAGAGLATVILAQVLTLVNEIRQLPVPMNYVGWGGFGLLVAALALAFLKLAWAYLRYKTTPRLPSLHRILNDRAVTRREQSLRHVETLRQRLVPLVKEYEIDDPGAQRELMRCGATQAQVGALSACRAELLRGARGGDRAWVEQFEGQFLAPMDGWAAKRIAAGGWRVFKLTGVSQRGGIDTVVMLVESMSLMADLCRIYGVRATRADSFRLLLHVLTNAAIASQADHVINSATDFGADALSEGAGHMAALATKLGGKVFGSVTDAALNKFLISRLGWRAMKALRPVR